jgi:hypothetical protein
MLCFLTSPAVNADAKRESTIKPVLRISEV